jgi:hypothetical protein
MMEETLQCGRGAIHREGEPLAQDRNGEINPAHAAEHVGHEVTGLERFRVTLMRHLIVRSAVDIVKYWTRQASLGEAPEIVKVVTIAQTQTCSQSLPRELAINDQTRVCKIEQKPQRYHV